LSLYVISWFQAFAFKCNLHHRYVLENRVVHSALFEAAVRLGVICPPPAALAALHLGDSPGHLASVTLEQTAMVAGESPTRLEVKARLVVGADGVNSNLRQLAGLRAPGWKYGLKAAVGTVTTAAPHTTAWQRFLPDGPLALLPVTSDGSLSNVVWTTTPQEADRLVKLSDDEFAAEVHAALRGEGRYAFERSPRDEDEELAGGDGGGVSGGGGGGGGAFGGGGGLFGGSFVELQEKLVSRWGCTR
jgi:ubiquinone biosynthesis monooxygenase Coq6